MSDGKDKRVIDTNVPVLANQAVRPDTIPFELLIFCAQNTWKQPIREKEKGSRNGK